MELQKEKNKMGVYPVNKLLINMSLPIMISMLVQAMYNIVDSLFVARVGESALTALSLAFPIQNLIIAIAVGTGVGINALLSRSLGEGNKEEVDRSAMNGIFLGLMSYLAFLAFGLFFVKAYFKVQTDSQEIINLGYQYLAICSIFSFGQVFQMIFEKLLQATGKTFYTMITQGIGAIINIILDPILIFGLFGFPKLGVAGAALATIIGQILAMVLAIYFNLNKNHEITFSFKGFRPDKRTIGKIYQVGIPTIFMQAIASVMTFGMNKILLVFSETATAVFGVYFKLQSFVFMPVFGLNNGMVPIIAYNYGARNGERIHKTIKLSVIYAVSIMLIGLAIIQIFPVQIMQMFNASDYMMSIGIVALRIISLSFILAGVNVVASSVFQALGHGMSSLIVSAVRQLLILLPGAFLLSKLVGLDGVWIAFPVAEIVALILSLIFLKRVYRREINPLSMVEREIE